MVFFDTCVWIELCCATTPSNGTQQAQAQKASQLLADSLQNQEKIVTCKEQLLELVSAIQKVKLREYNKNCTKSSLPKVGDLKAYRGTADFANVKTLCAQAVMDVSSLATEETLCPYSVSNVLANMHLADINDYLYYNHCTQKGIDLYTFDHDYLNLGASPNIHVL